MTDDLPLFIYDRTALPTMSDLETAGVGDVLRPDETHLAVAAAVMRRLKPIEHRQVGSADVANLIRDTLEREIAAALRQNERWAACCRVLADPGAGGSTERMAEVNAARDEGVRDGR